MTPFPIWTEERLGELEKIASEATPGPWRVGDEEGYRASRPWTNAIAIEGGVDVHWATPPTLAWTTRGGGEEANAAHIATFDPPTALSLIAEVRRLRAERSLISADYARELQRALSVVSARVTGATNFNGEIESFAHIIERAIAQIDRFAEGRQALSTNTIGAGE